MTETIQRIVLASRPGEPTLDNFRSEKVSIPQPGSGQMLLRTLWLSLDPYMRGRMSDAPSYAKPVGIGDAMEGGTVSEALAAVFADRPALRGYVLDDQGALRRHVAVYVNGAALRDRERLTDPVGRDDEIYVFQALTGG